MRLSITTWVILLVGLGLGVGASVSLAQEFAGGGPGRATEVVDRAEKISRLNLIKKNIDHLEGEVERRRTRLEKATDEERVALNEEIKGFKTRLKQAHIAFVSTATEVNLTPVDVESLPKKRDLVQEAQALLEPVMDGVRRLSERPRRIEGLRTEIQNLTERLDAADRALRNLDALAGNDISEGVNKTLIESRQLILETRQDFEIQLENVQAQLRQETKEEKPLFDSVAQMTREFFGTKGKNLLIAVLSFVATLGGLSFVRKRFFRSEFAVRKLKRLYKPMNTLYGFIAILVAFVVAMITLYVLHDWLLVTFFLLFLLGLIWSFKTLAPRLMNELKLILNLGTVKEGERVIWNDIPWLVSNLGLSSVLVNSELQGGEVVVPAGQLLPLLSRPVVEGEPWFPSRVGDHVLFGDDFYGEVIFQTPEQVVVRASNGLSRRLATAEYLKNPPLNYSRGFTLRLELSMNPRMQAQLGDGATRAVESKLRAGMSAHFSGVAPRIRLSNIGFEGASDKVLKFALDVDCDGDLAPLRDALSRELRDHVLQACNQAGVALCG